MKMPFPLLLLAIGFACCIVNTSTLRAEDELILRENDRVVFLGASYIERLQANNYLETLLSSSQPKRNITFRNLGWTGDTATGLSRAVFGSPEDGFTRLKKDLLIAKPTVVLVNYGGNEAFAGEAGLPKFTADMKRLLDFLQTTDARVVLMTPFRRSPAPEVGADFTKYNQQLDAYTAVLESLAKERDLALIDRREVLPGVSQKQLAQPLNQLSDDGVHLSPYGYWRTAPWVARELGESLTPWRVSLTADKGLDKASGAEVAKVAFGKGSVSFEAVDETLPPPVPPRFSPTGAELLMPYAELKVAGLKPGVYGLQIDGKPIVRADEKHWALGVRFRRDYAEKQVEELRSTIAVKNEYFFHRIRPQNETYLLLFRKHEQGNNAVEIPQFDPLIAAKESEIDKLKQPEPHTFKLVRLNEQ